MMHQPPFDHAALVDFDALLVHIPFDPGAGLEFEGFRSMNRAMDGAVDHDVRGLDFAVDACVRRHDQRAGLVVQRRDVSAHHAVDAQSAAEDDVAVDTRGGANQAVDAVLRLALLVEHCSLPHSVTVCVARGWLEPDSYTRACTFSTFALGLTRKVPSTRRKYLNASRNAEAPASAGSGKLIIALCPPSLSVTISSRRPLNSRSFSARGVTSSS